MTHKKKILLVTLTSTLSFGEKSLGGVDSVCQAIIKSLVGKKSEDYEYRVLAFDPTSKAKYTGAVQQLSENVSVVVAPCSDKINGIRLPGIISQLIRVHKQIIDFRPDVVHSHSESWLIGVSSRHKRIVTLHGYKKICRKSVSASNDFLYVNIVPRLSQLFIDEFTCVGEIIRNALEQDTNKPISIIRNPINDVFFSHHNIQEHNPWRFVTCSNLNPRKRLDRVISLIYSLKRKGVNAELTIIGSSNDDRCFEQLRQQAKQYGISDNVFFLGRMSQKDIANIYQASDFGVFLSEEETFGLAPLEMLAAGLPIIATKVGLLEEEREFFEGNGVFYYDEIKDLDCIVSFLQSRSEQMTKIPHDWLMDKFSSEKIVAAYENLYQ